MNTTYDQLRLNASLRADQIDTLAFLLQTERGRIRNINPDACEISGSYASRVEELHGYFQWLSDHNLIHSAPAATGDTQ